MHVKLIKPNANIILAILQFHRLYRLDMPSGLSNFQHVMCGSWQEISLIRFNIYKSPACLSTTPSEQFSRGFQPTKKADYAGQCQCHTGTSWRARDLFLTDLR